MSDTCEVPDCDQEAFYLGFCEEHAEEEFGPQYPDVGDLIW